MPDAAYNHSHQLQRAAALAALPDGSPCPLCGGPMWKQLQKLHYDHIVPVANGGANGPKRIVHAFCNMSRGGRAGVRITNAIRRGTRPPGPTPERPSDPRGTYNRW